MTHQTYTLIDEFRHTHMSDRTNNVKQIYRDAKQIMDTTEGCHILDVCTQGKTDLSYMSGSVQIPLYRHRRAGRHRTAGQKSDDPGLLLQR